MIKQANIHYDMDDVMVDLFGYLKRNFGIQRDMTSDNATDIGLVMDELVPLGMFEFLPPKEDFELGIHLARRLRAAGHNLSVASSKTKRADNLIIEGQKVLWLHKRVPDFNQIFNRGHHFCNGSTEKGALLKQDGNPNVLIDDFSGAGKSWQQAGGLWIQHTNFLESIRELKKYGIKPA